MRYFKQWGIGSMDWKSLLKNAAAALVGGGLFALLHIPLPWTLGPLAAVMVYHARSRAPRQWPVSIRNAGLLVLGCMIGLSFQAEAGRQILRQLPYMLGTTLVVIGSSLLLGYWLTRRLGLSRSTGILGSIPGGFTQMIAVSGDIPDSDVTVVTFMQITRYLTVVFTVPFLTLHLLPQGTGAGAVGVAAAGTNLADMNPGALLFFILAVLAGVWVLDRGGLPTPYLIGPMVVSAVLVLCGCETPQLPLPLIYAAQLCFGGYTGSSMRLSSLQGWKRLLAHCLVFSVSTVLAALAVGYLLVRLLGIEVVTAFIATAPGGVAEMGITAAALRADISIVASYQLFRVFFIMFLVPPALKWRLRGDPAGGIDAGEAGDRES
jgi:hypothetical protein